MGQVQATKENLTEKLFTILLSLLGAGIFLHACISLFIHPPSMQWVLLSAVTILIVSRIDLKIPIISSSTLTVSDTFIFISLLLYGVLPSVVLAGVDATVHSLNYKNRLKVIPFNLGATCFPIYVAGVAVQRIIGEIPGASSPIGRLLMAAGLLALIQYALNSGIVSIVVALRNHKSVFSTWRESFLWTSVTYFAGAAAASMVVKLIAVISYYAFILTVPILGATYLTYKIYLEKVEVSARHAQQMADLHMRTIEALAIAIDAKDEVTHEHVRRVQIYAEGLARLFGLSDSEVQSLQAGALLHDIGKLAVPDYILNKPGRLTPAEFEKMKIHTIVGAQILERVDFPYPVVPVVRHHHERWDGNGYPDRLKGEQIPLTARILSVADCFDAVREDRQYRKAMTRAEAITLVQESSGKMYDPEVVRVFLENLPEFEKEIRRQKVERGEESDRAHSLTDPREVNPDGGENVFEHIRSAHREVSILYEIAQTIGTSLDLRDTFAVFASRLQDIVSYTTCVLYLIRPDAPAVEAVHVSGRNADQFKGKRMHSGSGITGWVTANRHPMYNSDPRLDFDQIQLEFNEPYKTSMVVPLLRDGEALGALALYSVELNSYESDHLRLFEAVAKLASDAIGNALHHEETEASALADSLTNLPNARALRHRFDDQLDQYKRGHGGFAIVMMDLDGFKNVNDMLGHQAGNTMLREVAQVLTSLLRPSDFLCRYAGDEFVALLQARPTDVGEVLKRIQRALDRHNFGQEFEDVFEGASMGWASYGVDGTTLDELLLIADRGMYADKTARKANPVKASVLASTRPNLYQIR